MVVDVEINELVDEKLDTVSPFTLDDIAKIRVFEMVEDREVDELLEINKLPRLVRD